MRGFTAVIVAALIVLLLPLAVQAAVFNVIDVPGLRQALVDASANQEDDTIQVAAGIYDLTTGGTLVYQPGAAGFGGDNHALTVNGADQGTTILDGKSLGRVLTLNTASLANDSAAHLTLSNLSIVNGLTSGYNDSGAGALIVTGAARVDVTNTTFGANRGGGGHSDGGGAEIITASGAIVLAGSTFSNNISRYGGGGAYVRSNTGAITFTGNDFIANSSSDWVGGAAYVVGGTVNFENNLFTGSNSVQWGGALHCEGTATTLNANVFSTNTSNMGAGAYIGSASLILTNNIFSGNIADGGTTGDGGGVRLVSTGGRLTMTNNSFAGNSATGKGGGGLVRVLGGTVGSFYNNILRGNTSSLGGNDGDDLYLDSDGSEVNFFNNDVGDDSTSVIVSNTTQYAQGANIAADCLPVGSFDLVPGSACIDAGSNSAPSLPVKDSLGNPRIKNGTVDIGAREYLPPPPPYPVFEVNPTSFHFEGVTRGANPPAQTLTITNGGSQPLNWSATYPLPSWLGMSPSYGTDATTISMSISNWELATGTYTATIELTAPGAAPVSIPITFTLHDGPTFYVDVNNTSGVEDGTAAHPFNTIQEALAGTQPGDIVLVLPGTYYGFIQLIDGVTLVSQGGPEVTVLDGNNTNSYTIFTPVPGAFGRGYVKGFTVLNTGGSGLCTSSHSTGGWTWNGDWLEIERCILRDVSGTAIFAFPSATVKVTNTLIRNVGGVAYTYYGGMYLTNVTVDQATYGFSSYYGNYTLTNTTVSNVTTVFVANSTLYLYGSHNNFWHNTNYSSGTISGSPTASLNVDPLFVNPPTDYNLQDASLLIDAGIDAGLPFFRAAPDIGAYENYNEINMDVDADGYTRVTDCDDHDPITYPGAPELCDGKDNNCDGQIDEGFGTLEVCAGGSCAYSSIQSAVDAATGCQTVLVYEGIYVENVNLGNKRITLKSAAGAATTIIDGSAPSDPNLASVVSLTGPARIEGLTIRNGRGTLVNGFRFGAGIYAPGASPVIQSCTITGNIADVGNDSTSSGGGIYAYKPTISDCTITNNQAHASGGGISASAPTVTNCLIADNSANWGSGMAISGGAVRNSVIRHNGWTGIMSGWGGGIAMDGSAEITNCLVAENQAGEGAGIRVYRGAPTITNTTIAGNSGTALSMVIASPKVVNSIVWGGLYFYGSSTLTASYSDIQGGYAGAGNIDVDPQFANAAASDYRLGDASPCRDAGTATGAPETDLLGVPRPFGAGIDIGAYEWRDRDGDGYGEATDCNDQNANVHPGAPEYCDGVDNNCDGQIDEGFGTIEVCAEGCQYTTIQSAINAASDCQTVLVHAGIYYENIDLGAKKLTLKSADGTDAIIDGSHPVDPTKGSVVTMGAVSAATVIDGFTIQNGTGTVSGSYRNGAGINTSGSPTIRNCLIDNNHCDGYGGGIYANAPVVSNCTLSNNEGHRVGGGIYGPSATISNCLIVNNYANWGSGIFIQSGKVRDSIIQHNGWTGPDAWGGGMEIEGSATITNCSVVDNRAGEGAGIRIYRYAVTITNTTIANNLGTALSMVAGASSKVVNSIIWGGRYCYSGCTLTATYSDIMGGYAGRGNIDADPQFVNPTAEDYNLRNYRLKATSPCRDAGTAAGAPPTDLLGVARPQGPRFDIGAYEWFDDPTDVPVANDQSVTTAENAPVALTLSATDIDGDALTYTVVTGPANGTLSGTAPNLTYNPAPYFNGADSFTFQAIDGTQASNTATVSITVTPVNYAPVANDQSVTTPQDTSLAVTLTATDVDGDALTYTVVNGPTHGTLSGTAPNLTYTPTANFKASDSFTFSASDGQLVSNTATVSITVTPVNHAPVANDQSVTTPEDTSLAVTLTATDVDGDALTYTVVNGPTHGTLSGTAPNLTYAPAANFSGSDSFTFTASDGHLVSNTATVSITVTPVNDKPVADAGPDRIGRVGQALTFSGTASYDVDGTIVSYSWNWGDGTANSSGVAVPHTYTTAGTFTATLTVTDNLGAVGTDTAIVTISAVPVNLALNKTALASSQRSSSYQASRAVDGSTSTSWMSSTTNGAQWVRVDLGASAPTISYVKVIWPATYYAKDFQIQTSTDGTTFTTRYTQPAGTGNGGTTNATFTTVSARYVRVYCTTRNNSSYYGVSELEVYALPPSNQAPVANAGADQNGKTGQVLTFSAAGSADPDGTIAGYAWNWGDNTPIGSGVTATHAFATAGTWTVTLTVTDNAGAVGIDVAIVTVTVNKPPVANAGPDQTGLVGQSLTFSGSGSSDPDGTIVSYSWNWGDNTPIGSGVSASHIFTTAGTYPVTLTVTDNNNATATDTAIVTVKANLALNKPAMASTTRSTTYAASKAVDGSTTTSWMSNTTASDQWVRVDLQAAYSITNVVVKWPATYYAKDFQIQTSTDGTNWTTRYTFASGSGALTNAVFAAASAQYVRVYCTRRNNSSYYGVAELEVYQ